MTIPANQLFTKTILQKDFFLGCPKSHFILVFILLAFSGNPALAIPFGWEPLLIGLGLYLVWLLIYQKKSFVEPRASLIFCIFGLLCSIHSITFQVFPYITIGGFFLRVFIGYTIIRLVTNFPIVYVAITVRLCQAGLLFWVLGKVGILKPLFSSLTPLHYNVWTGCVFH